MLEPLPLFPSLRLLQKSNTLETALAATLFAVVNAFFSAALSVDTPGTFAVPMSTPLANSAASAFAAAVDLSISLVRLLIPSKPPCKDDLMPSVSPNSPGLLNAVVRALEASVAQSPAPPQLIPKKSNTALIASPIRLPKPPMIPATASMAPMMLFMRPRTSPIISLRIPSTNVFKQPNTLLSAESTSVFSRSSIILEIIDSILPKLQKIILRICSMVLLIVDVIPLMGVMISLTS